MKPSRYLGTLACAAALPLAFANPSTSQASDHADGPTVAGDQAADLADCYLFPDPTTPDNLVLINTVRGFIVPGEAGNFAIFDSTIRYRFQIENTDDAKPDAFIDVSFSEKDSAAAQTATVVFSGSAFADLKGKFTGTATVAGLGATPPPQLPDNSDYFPATAKTLNDKNNAASVVKFFAGETDDPFFFDIPGFVRFRNELTKGTAFATAAEQLNRGRDTFAGYNVLTIALSIPKAQLVNTKDGSNTTKFGLNVLAQRATERVVKGRKVSSGAFKTVDREGFPAINALLVPIQLKNLFNSITTEADAKGVANLFAADPDVIPKGSEIAAGIVKSLVALGSTEATFKAVAGVVLAKGDILRIDTTKLTSFATFNGRNPADDVVKTLLSVITNKQAPDFLDDNVPQNDVLAIEPEKIVFNARFPYLGLPHQPLASGATDGTKN